MKLELKKQAIDLRRRGYLYAEIATRLQIARSTAHAWTHNLRLTELQKQHLYQRKIALQRTKMINLAARKRVRYLEREQLLLKRAQVITSNATLNADSKRVMCAVLYWCEGTKDVSSGIKFTNADPILIQQFLVLLREGFAVDESKFRALLHLHEYHDATKQLDYWSKISGIPGSQFHKSYIKPRTGKNKHIDYPGCISIRYLDASLGKLLKMIYSEYGQKP